MDWPYWSSSSRTAPPQRSAGSQRWDRAGLCLLGRSILLWMTMGEEGQQSEYDQLLDQISFPLSWDCLQVTIKIVPCGSLGWGWVVEFISVKKETRFRKICLLRVLFLLTNLGEVFEAENGNIRSVSLTSFYVYWRKTCKCNGHTEDGVI
jgi:hypothetical protein